MGIAPLAALGIAKTAFSLLESLVGAARRRPSPASPSVPSQESLWHQIGQAVDIRSLSEEDLAKVSRLLYENGEISSEDHAMLTGNFMRSDARWLTAADEAGRRDWIAEFQARLDRHLAQRDTRGAAQDQRVLDILCRLRAGANGAISMRV